MRLSAPSHLYYALNDQHSLGKFIMIVLTKAFMGKEEEAAPVSRCKNTRQAPCSESMKLSALLISQRITWYGSNQEMAQCCNTEMNLYIYSYNHLTQMKGFSMKGKPASQSSLPLQPSISWEWKLYVIANWEWHRTSVNTVSLTERCCIFLKKKQDSLLITSVCSSWCAWQPQMTREMRRNGPMNHL